MSKWVSVLLEVVVIVAIFDAGAIVHDYFDFKSWFIPWSMVPGSVWLWWRGVAPNRAFASIIPIIVILSALFAIEDALWRNPPFWLVALYPLIGIVVICCADKLVNRCRRVFHP